MTTLPPAPETLLQLIKCSCSKSVCETSWCKCKANNLYYSVLICVAVEQKRTRVRTLYMINMYMTFEQLFLSRFRLSLALSTCWSYKISEYDQEIPQSQTTDKSMAP